MKLSEVNWIEVKWSEVLRCSERVYNNFFKLCVQMAVLYSNQFSLVFLYSLTNGVFTWSGMYFVCSVLCVLCCFILLRHGTILCVIVFFLCVTVSFRFTVLFIVICSSVFFFLLCMCTWLFIVLQHCHRVSNPVAVNIHPSIHPSINPSMYL